MSIVAVCKEGIILLKSIRSGSKIDFQSYVGNYRLKRFGRKMKNSVGMANLQFRCISLYLMKDFGGAQEKKFL